MREYRFDTLGSLDALVLHEIPVPAPRRGEVLIKVEAASLNYRDLAVVQGDYVWNAQAGLVPCSDAAGEVVAVGEGVKAWREGDRVVSLFHPRWFGGEAPVSIAHETYGSGQDGWLAEYKLVDQEAILRMPDTLDFRAAATLPCAATTAFNALTGQCAVRPGDTVLTLGSGGVSIFAIQVAKAFGARVIATTSSETKADRLLALGADEVVNYRTTPDWGKHIKAQLTGGRGVDRVVEVGGPGTIRQSLDAVRWGGEIVLIGFVSKDDPNIDYFQLKGAGATVRSVGVGDRAIAQASLKMISAAGIQPVIDRVFPFEEAQLAFRHLAGQQHFGKVVIDIPG